MNRIVTYMALVLVACTAGTLWADSGQKTEHRMTLSMFYEQAAYVPYQFQMATDDWLTSTHYRKVEGNRIAITPVTLSYMNRSSGWGFEGAYESITLADWGLSYADFGVPGRVYAGRTRENTLHRQQAHIVAVKRLLDSTHTLDLRGGLQNITTWSGYSSLTQYYRNKVPAWGLRAGLRYEWQFAESLSAGLRSDLFWAKGKRIYESAYADSYWGTSYLSKEWGSSATKGEWFGLDSMLFVSWKVSHALTIDTGFRTDVGFFRYVHYAVSSIPYNNSYGLGANNGYKLAGVPSYRDHITGWTLGLTLISDF